ncbi:hypothetical protein F5Y01DRAFT_316274 [Xylaria sp. FL0043]|nr:hypothetical protein F5Y01DRAFT_316274 [Xylaria sp. FL0043]
MISTAIAPGGRHSMAGLTSDGATDTHPLVAVQPDIPRYNLYENGEEPPLPQAVDSWVNVIITADSVPKYTREYLHKLSSAVDSRLKINDDELSYYTEALAKTRKVHKYLISVLLVLAFLWLVTSILLLVAMFTGHLARRRGR